ncbi:transposase [Streptomyces sp. NPDC060054]|uniref:transposase n=1 Tax=unclassified Streptomyces TaxID=2593676 RepID=UPI0036BABCFB
MPSVTHLAAYAGLAPTTRSSGDLDPRRTRTPRRKPAAKRTMFLSAFACMNADPAPRAYHDKQRAPAAKPHPSTPATHPPTHQRPVRHAPRRHLLRIHNSHHQPRRMTTPTPTYQAPRP